MPRRRWVIAACVGVAVVGLVMAFRVGPAGTAAPAGQPASIRFRTALCRQSDDWCFVS